MLAVTRAVELVSCSATDIFLAFTGKLFCYHIKLFTQLAEGIRAAVSLEESSIREMTAKFVGFMYFLPIPERFVHSFGLLFWFWFGFLFLTSVCLICVSKISQLDSINTNTGYKLTK